MKRNDLDQAHLYNVMDKLGIPHPKLKLDESENNKEKKTINEISDVDKLMQRTGLSDEQMKNKVEDMKKVLDKLESEKDYETLNALVGLLLGKKYRAKNNLQEHHSEEHERKVDLMKGKLDFFFDNDHYDIIDKLDNIFNKLFNEKIPQ